MSLSEHLVFLLYKSDDYLSHDETKIVQFILRSIKGTLNIFKNTNSHDHSFKCKFSIISLIFQTNIVTAHFIFLIEFFIIDFYNMTRHENKSGSLKFVPTG